MKEISDIGFSGIKNYVLLAWTSVLHYLTNICHLQRTHTHTHTYIYIYIHIYTNKHENVRDKWPLKTNSHLASSGKQSIKFPQETQDAEKETNNLNGVLYNTTTKSDYNYHIA